MGPVRIRTRKKPNMKRILHFACTVGALAMVGLAAAQTEIKASRTFTVNPGTPIDTLKLRPAIDNSVHYPPRRPENELVFNWEKADPRNNLKAGGMLPNIRVSPLQGKFPSIGFTGWVPPDCDMAVGPQWVVCVVNSSLGFYRKADGVNTFLKPCQDFYAGLGATSFQFDPKALYDPISKRFFVLYLEQDDATKISKLLLAVSDDNDPNGTWYRYRIESKITDSGTDYWLDYPGFGVSKDYVGFSGNMFGFTGGWLGNQFVVVNKASLLTGGTATVSSIQDRGSASVKIAKSVDTSALYALSVDAGDQLKVQSVTNTEAKSVIVKVPTMSPPQGPVPGPSGHNLDALDGRLFNLLYKNGYLVSAHGVTINGDPKEVSRWYDINLNGWPAGSKTPTLAQSGNVASSTGQYFHMPAVAKNKRGEMAVIFSRTSSTIQADLMVTGRKSTDPVGSMGAPVVQATTPAPYGGSGGYNRWGDYFGLDVDPVDDVTFWAYGMIGRADGRWATVVFPFKVTNYSDVVVPIKAAALSVLAGQGKLTTTGTSQVDVLDSITANVDSQAAAGVGLATSLRVDWNTTLTPATVGSLQLNAKFAAPADATVFYYFWNNVTNAWEQLQATPASQVPAKFERIEQQASPFVNAAGKVSALVRIVRPNRAGTAPYTLKVDQLALSAAPKF